MRRLAMPALLAFWCAASHAGTAALDQEKPVNLIVETGLDVGPCPDGGALGYPPAPYKGSPHFLGRADGRMAAKHDALTKHEAPWLRRLDGPSGANRLFTATEGERILVFRSCKRHDCSANIAYGAYALASGDYAVQLREESTQRTLGTSSPKLQAAIACARLHDDRRRAELLDLLTKSPGK